MLYSQVDLHADYGGVVPELASRDHVRKIAPLTRQLMERSHYKLSDLDGIAYTAGQGLMGALLVGATYAENSKLGVGYSCLSCSPYGGAFIGAAVGLNTSRHCPLSLYWYPVWPYPTGAGARTRPLRNAWRVSRRCRRQAFDKTAKLLDFDYPGGPAVAKAAQRAEARNKQLGVARPDFAFPDP